VDEGTQGSVAAPAPTRAPSDASTDLELFRQVYARARRFASFVAPTDVDPDDLTHDALARVLARGPLLALDEPLAYLRTTMLNLLRNEHRRRGREQRAWGRSGAVEQVEARHDVVGRDAVRRMLASLPPPTRAIVFLVELEGCSIGEAAEVVGLSVAATTARLSRARRSLRVEVGMIEEREP
jgi:RNA polymerase sigma factor (sigma-70 family)